MNEKSGIFYFPSVARVPCTGFSKTDMYGRFVADIFYHPTIKQKEEIYAKGFFLNLDLLTAGLADPMP